MTPTATSAPRFLPLMPQRRTRADCDCALDNIDSKLPQKRPRSPRTPSPTRLTRAELTIENLDYHTRLENPGEAHNMAGASSATTTVTNVDDETKLTKYGVALNSHKPLPPALQSHIDKIVMAPRAPESPSAKALHLVQPFAAAWGSESKAIELITKYLMFPDRTDPLDERGERDISFVHEAQFDRQYVQHTDGTFLTQPRPDRTNAYLSQYNTCDLVPAAFTEEEEAIICEGSIHKEALFPWLIGEFNSAKIGIRIAVLQCARTGLAVNNYLAKFYRRADIEPTVVETCHWSIACNPEIAHLLLHWRAQDGRYHVHSFSRASLRAPFSNLDRNEDMVKMRKCLRNILEYARNERLQRLKQVIAAIQKKENTEVAQLPLAPAALPRRRQSNSTLRRSGTSGPAVAFDMTSDEGYSSRRNVGLPQQVALRRSGRTPGAPSKRRRTDLPEDDDESDELAWL
jgi:hypothetical protein